MKMYSNTASFLSGLVDLETCQFDLNLYLETSDSEIESSEEQLHTSDSYLERHLQLRRSLRLVKPVRNLYITYRDAIISNQCEGVVLVASMGDKGRGIVTTQSFCRGDFILEYKGDMINKKEAARREEHYKRIPEMGCFMFYFVHDGKRLCIDGTKDTRNLGRLVNHDRSGTCRPLRFAFEGHVHIIFIARSDIKAGEEVTYDYFDRDRETILNFPWLA